MDVVRTFDRTIHLSASLVSNLVNQKVAPASQLTLTGLQLWVDAVREALAAEAAAASSAGAAGAASAAVGAGAAAFDAAGSVAADNDQEMLVPSQRKGERARVKTARAMGQR